MQFGPGGRSARILFDGRAVSPAGAALAGGMTIDALDGHDGHRLAMGHVGCGLLPATLAFAEAEELLDGGEFLTALVIGYEIGSRAGIALHQTASDYHTSGAWIAVTCAAIGARALKLDSIKTKEAVGIAEYHGPRSQMMRCIDWPTMLKDGSGWGAMAGMSAAYLAASGFTGAPALTIEGDDVLDLWADLGTRWYLFEQYHKPYPVCRWAQPPLEAVLHLRKEHGLTSDQVERIEVTTFHQSVRLATRRPRSTEEAQYSTAFPTAAAMVRGKVAPEEVAPEAFGDPEILRLSEGMLFAESDDYSAAFPDRRFADVRLVLKDGRRLSSGRFEARGDPGTEVPLSEVREKFHAYADPVIGSARASAIEAAVERLEEGMDMTTLAAHLAMPSLSAETVGAALKTRR